MVYLDNIIIYLNSEKEYKEYMEQVLRRLYKENILVIIKKYKFYTKKADFIGFIIKLKKISINLKKIKAIVNWQDLESIINLKSFLKFCNYCRRFITNQLSKIELFTKMTRKDKN